MREKVNGETEAGSHWPMKDCELIRNVMGSPLVPRVGATCNVSRTNSGGKKWKQKAWLGNSWDNPEGRLSPPRVRVVGAEQEWLDSGYTLDAELPYLLMNQVYDY